MKRGGAIYILTNKNNTTLYTGVTSNLRKRVTEHRMKINLYSFSARYNLCKLVYFEVFNFIEQATSREKQIKGGSRKKKVELINSINPNWEDLFDTIK